MSNGTSSPLTFATLDARIEAMPEGPVSVLRSPGWTRCWTLLGTTGLVLGVSQLVHDVRAAFASWLPRQAYGGARSPRHCQEPP